MTRLTQHFTVEEFTHSQTAARLGIDNSLPASLMDRAVRTCQGLEQVRVLLNANAINISSGYRSEALEKVICKNAYQQWCKRHGKTVNAASWAEYFSTKAHSRAEAADFTSPFAAPRRIIETIVNSDLAFDQVILEYDAWVHISFSDRNRKQTLIIDNQDTRSFT